MNYILFVGKINQVYRNITENLNDFELESFEPSKLEMVFGRINKGRPDGIIIDSDDFNPLYLKKFIKSIFFLTEAQKDQREVPLIVLNCPSWKEDDFDLKGGRFYHYKKTSFNEEILYCVRNILMSSNEYKSDVVKVYSAQVFPVKIPLRVTQERSSSLICLSNHIFVEGEEIIDDMEYYNKYFLTQRYKISEESNYQSFNKQYVYKLDYLPLRSKVSRKQIGDHQMSIAIDIQGANINFEVYKAILKDLKPKKFSLIATTESDEDYDYDGDVEKQILANELKVLQFHKNMKHSNVKNDPGFNITFFNFSLKYPLLNILKDHTHPFEPIFRRKIIEVNEVTRKDFSSIYVINFGEGNSLEEINALIRSFTNFNDYFPFVLIFNYDGEMSVHEIRDYFQYHFIISTKSDLDLRVVEKLFQTYLVKYNQGINKEAARRLKNITADFPLYDGDKSCFLPFYRNLNEEEQTVFIEREIEMVWMSEFEVIFLSQEDFVEGETFYVEGPLGQDVKVVKHLKGSKEEKVKNCYRGVFQQQTEKNVSDIRRFIFKLHKELQGNENLVSLKKINDLKTKNDETGEEG